VPLQGSPYLPLVATIVTLALPVPPILGDAAQPPWENPGLVVALLKQRKVEI